MVKGKTYGYKYNYVVIDEIFYEADMKDGKTILVPVPKKRLEKEIKIGEEIVEKLKDETDVKVILMEAIMQLSDKEREKLHNLLYKAKKTYKIKTREDHCVDLKIGNYVLPIIH